MGNCSTASEALCRICPRRCAVSRSGGFSKGFCGMGSKPVVARCAPHFGEEPCISGTRGAGAVFFSGCNLRCVFCQNRVISAERYGKEISVARLRELFLELKAQGVHNIDLVTPTHFAPAVREAIGDGIGLPIVWNSGGYDSVETLRNMEGAVQIYMPDLKYLDAALAGRLSAAPDYPEVAKAALQEMFRQVGPAKFDADGLLCRGLLIRHLVLPGHLDNSLDVIDYVASAFPPGSVLLSLMSQYTPHGEIPDFPELSRPLTKAEHRRVKRYLENSAITAGYFQDMASATDEYLPLFDLSGV